MVAWSQQLNYCLLCLHETWADVLCKLWAEWCGGGRYPISNALRNEEWSGPGLRALMWPGGRISWGLLLWGVIHSWVVNWDVAGKDSSLCTVVRNEAVLVCGLWCGGGKVGFPQWCMTGCFWLGIIYRNSSFLGCKLGYGEGYGFLWCSVPTISWYKQVGIDSL